MLKVIFIRFSVLYKQIDVKKDPTVSVLDVNKLSTDGSIALGTFRPSRDGSLFAYGLTTNGSEWNTIKIRDVETRKDYPEELKYVRYSEISWYEKGFFYCVCTKMVTSNQNISF